MFAKFCTSSLFPVCFLGTLVVAACGAPVEQSRGDQDLTTSGPDAGDGGRKQLHVQVQQSFDLGSTPQTFIFEGQKGWVVHYSLDAPSPDKGLHFIPHISIQQLDNPANFLVGKADPTNLGDGLADIAGIAQGNALPLTSTGKWLVTVRAATHDETLFVLKQANSSVDPKEFASTGPFFIVLNVDLPCHHAGDDHHKNPDNCPAGLFCTQLKDGWDWSKSKGAPQCLP